MIYKDVSCSESVSWILDVHMTLEKSGQDMGM